MSDFHDDIINSNTGPERPANTFYHSLPCSTNGTNVLKKLKSV